MTTFNELGLLPDILKALEAEGYSTPTPIQSQAIPAALAGRDLLGLAQTGTGKTAAFALPILQQLAIGRRPPQPRGVRALVLSPTRELASQIADSFRAYGRHLGLKVAVVYGGVGMRPQIDTLHRGVDVLVATPGRLIDHMGQRTVALDGTEILVLDEADQMLDLGFILPIRRIVRELRSRRQSLFFSATMPKEIGQLAAELLKDPERVQVAPVAKTLDKVEQRVIYVEAARKRELLAELLADPAMSRTLVFTRTKRGADRVARHLSSAGIAVAAIHGDKSQGQRERALADFKGARIRALVATDIAARGIDVDQVTHVVNFELPNIPESYVHRIGRTARAGATGIAISLVDGEERAYLADIEKLTRQHIPAVDRRGGVQRATPVRDGAAAGRGHQPDREPEARRGGKRPRQQSRDAGRQGERSAEPRQSSRPRASKHGEARPEPGPWYQLEGDDRNKGRNGDRRGRNQQGERNARHGNNGQDNRQRSEPARDDKPVGAARAGLGGVRFLSVGSGRQAGRAGRGNPHQRPPR